MTGISPERQLKQELAGMRAKYGDLADYSWENPHWDPVEELSTEMQDYVFLEDIDVTGYL